MSEITIGDLTSGRTDGDGVFDVLMRAISAHLEEQYNQKRIKGSDYAQVYATSLTEVMQQAMAYTLQHEKAGKEADLLQAQIDNELRKTPILTEELEKLRAETALLGSQKLSIEAQTELAGKQGTKLDDDLLTSAKQRDKMDKELEVADQQLLKLVEETDLVNKQVANAISQNSLLTQQVLKVVAETSLMEQKVSTEKAQISDVVDGAPVGGVIGKQVDLYTAQADGFKRDAEQKLAKMMVDSWSVRRTTDDTTPATDAGLGDTEVNKVLNKAKQGIGVS